MKFRIQTMGKLPKRFPEYSIMYQTLSKRIQGLEEEKKGKISGTELEEIQLKIKKYQKELNRIKEMFPEKFFE